MAEPTTRKLLLIGWDAADWELITPLLHTGRMPNLKRLIDAGVMGNLQSLQPMLSPILWTSIATGKRADQHGILGFVEPTPDSAGLRPTASTSRTCKALWNILSQAGKRCHAIGWYVSHPAESINGVCVSSQFAVPPASATPDAWPPQPNSVEPERLAESLAELRLHPDEFTGPALAQFIPLAHRLDQRDPETRRLLSALARRLAECASVHAVTTALMEEQPWDFCTVYYETIDQIGHDFMCFRPPRMAHIRPDHFEVFGGVMDIVYEFHDQMLGRLVELAGPDATIMIVSDHGFKSGSRRPLGPVEPAQWHRNFGVLAASGPGLKTNQTIHGATLLDIAPTILTLFGLPVGRDMEGRVLVNAFENPPDIERIPSWDSIHDPVSSDSAAPKRADDPEAEAAAIQQLIELGYLEAPGEDTLRDIARARTEQKFNLACSCADGKQFARALALAEQLVAEAPAEIRYLVLFGQTAVSAGNTAALDRAIRALAAAYPDHEQLILFRAFRCWLTDDIAGALRHFQSAAARAPQDPWLLCRIGRAFLRLRNWPAAQDAFQQALALDPDSAEACYGLSVALPRQGRVEEGISYGLQSVSLMHDYPLAHFQLGAMLSRLGWFERALQAFDLCLAMRPDFALAHRYVSLISARLGDAAKAETHRAIAKRILDDRLPQPTVD